MGKDTNIQTTFESLSIGMRGTMIYVVQKTLNSIGYEIESDGVFTEEMLTSVKHFQETRGNLVPNGIVDYMTMKEMDTAFGAYIKNN